MRSRISMQDGSRTETNWPDLRLCDADAAELVERDPHGVMEPRGCLYVGGGSGLFRRSLLRQFIRRTLAYAPFFWEDVEWGSLAWRYGYPGGFWPRAEGVHRPPPNLARYYSEAEVARVFERNRLLYHLRNLSRLSCLEERLLSLDRRSWSDIIRPRVLLGSALAKAIAYRAPYGEEVLVDRWKGGPYHR